MQDKKSVKYIINNDGEILSEIYENDKIIIQRESQKEAIEKAKKTKNLNKEMEGINKELGGFVFALFKYSNDLLKDCPELTPEDITKLFYLATFVDYEGYLIYENQYIKRKKVQELLRMSNHAFITFINKVKKLKIILEDDNRNIKIVKDYFSKGELDNEIKQYYDYTRIYIKTIRYLFENVSIRKHKQLGNYFKMIPYIHRQQNLLCWNPSSNCDSITLMHVKELKNILGYHKNGVRGFIKELLSTKLENGHSIVGFFRTEYDEGKSYIIVNPDVFYGGNFDIKDGRSSIIKWFYINKNKQNKGE